jgi:hypothetical protein
MHWLAESLYEAWVEAQGRGTDWDQLPYIEQLKWSKFAAKTQTMLASFLKAPQ